MQSFINFYRVDEKEEAEDDISSKLAFHADPDKLDDDGKPRSKISRKSVSFLKQNVFILHDIVVVVALCDL